MDACQLKTWDRLLVALVLAAIARGPRQAAAMEAPDPGTNQPPETNSAPNGPATTAAGVIFEPQQIEPGQKRTLHFDAPPVPTGHEAVLTFQARLVASKPAGYAPAMRVVVNGQSLEAADLLNKKPVELRTNGSTQSMAAGTRLVVGYAADFESPDHDATYALPGAKVCLFELRVTKSLREGGNRLILENTLPRGLDYPLAVSAGRLVFRAPADLPRKAGPPTGPLPLRVPAATHQVDYTAKLRDDGSVTVGLGGETFRVQSTFSTPEPNWRHGSNRYFQLQRRIERRPEAILIHDTFTNLSAENLPLMQRHRVRLPLRRVWLAGLSPSSKRGRSTEPANPTVFGATGRVGLGLLPLDDVFQVHVVNSCDGQSIGLADESLVLKPGATHTAEWAIVPTTTPDYFAMVNAVRRLRAVNFRIDGGFAFLRSDPRLVGKWSDQQVAAFIRNKDARFVCLSIDYPRYQGHYPHGTAFQTLDLGAWKKAVIRRRRLVPGIQQLGYFHAFIDVSDGAEKRYADARILLSNGAQADYGQPYDKLFLPTANNAYGRAIARNVDKILDDAGCDGVYWDEFAYSRVRYHFGQPWDGVSGDIDPQTLKILRLKSSVALITQSWRLALAQRILAHGPLVGNGAPHTRTMTRLHFPRFIETGSISNCARGQLFTPIALGDHLTERGEVDAYRVMLRALDYGCVYYWYNDVTVVPTHHHLTRYMFPITPVELHQGYLFGTDRIITNRSGRFGWNDRSGHEVHVFNPQGREVADFDAPTVVEDGHTLTELRIGADYSAAILRRPQAKRPK